MLFVPFRRKTIQPGFARGKCTPSAAYGGVSPRESVSHDSHSPAAPYESCSLATPEGQILAALCDEMLMRTKAPRRADFPHRGKYRRRRG